MGKRKAVSATENKKGLRHAKHGRSLCIKNYGYSILERNAFRRGCLGLVNSSCGGSSS